MPVMILPNIKKCRHLKSLAEAALGLVTAAFAAAEPLTAPQAEPDLIRAVRSGDTVRWHALLGHGAARGGVPR